MRRFILLLTASIVAVTGTLFVPSSALAAPFRIVRVWCESTEYYDNGMTLSLCYVDATGGVQPYSYRWEAKGALLPYGNTTLMVEVSCRVGTQYRMTAGVTDATGFRLAQQTPWLNCAVV